MFYSIKIGFITSLSLFLLLLSSLSFAADPVYTGLFSHKALGGYDSVAYFSLGKAVKGLAQFNYRYQGAIWYFSNDRHLALFSQNPQQYAPQYGGYCAYAIANNEIVSSDPQQWSIINDKLYLNYDAEVQQLWLQQQDKYIHQADRNWPHIIADE